MQDEKSPPRAVAVFNRTPDTLLMLRVALEHAGFTVVPVLLNLGRDVSQLEDSVRAHRPEVVVYDVAPPYEAEWLVLRQLKRTGTLARCYFVVTSTHRAQVEQLIGADAQIYAVFGTPYDLKEIVDAVRGALNAGPYQPGERSPD